jgi:two-component system nitrate/nitrite response regulator NarL
LSQLSLKESYAGSVWVFGMLKKKKSSKKAKIKKISVLLLESNNLLREGLLAMLEIQKDITPVAFGDYEAALENAKEQPPDVLLIDVGIDKLSSIEIIALFKKNFPKIAVVVINLAPMQTSVIDFVKAGTTGFITKSATLKDFLHTIRATSRGEKVIPPHITDSLFNQVLQYGIQHNQENIISESVQMTAREREVINFIAAGNSNKEISEALNISVQTVKTHVHNILEKMSFRSRLELANYVYSSRTNDVSKKNGGLPPDQGK